jgi:predicted DNA-binding helix-hairpin-helix protein
MPGAEKDQVLQAMKLSDRLSINLEAPHSRALSYLAPRKNFETELLKPLHWIEEFRQSKSPHQAWNGKWPSSTTQFVVGAAGESDLDLLSTTANLYRHENISRIYFSSFTPFEDTPLENKPASPIRREFRLYQASFLIRDYGYSTEDLVYQNSGNLPLDLDPKLAWAQQHLIGRPIEINHAPYHILLRIPGIGPARAMSIITLRNQEKINSISILRKHNLISSLSTSYILINGKSPAQQLHLF